MSNSVHQDKIYQKLATIRHPEIPAQNLVTLGMIPSISIEQEIVQVTLALPNLEVPVKQEIIRMIHESLSNLSEKYKIEIHPEEMTPEQKSIFFDFAKKARIIHQKSSKIGKVLAVMSGKGGVGKSSVAGLLASSLRRLGLQVGILDADITGPSIPMMFGIDQRPRQSQEGLFPIQSRTGIKLISINLLLPDKDQPVVWRGPMISKAIEQFWADIIWGNLDYLVVDLPPGTADAALTVMQSLPLDGIILVTSPQDLAGMVVRKAANMAKAIGIPLIGLIENMSHTICPHCGEIIDIFGTSKAESTARMIETTLLAHLPLDPQFAEKCDNGTIENHKSDILDRIADKITKSYAAANITS
jgi:Mrp family chromosome partitioning ATPase